MTASEDHGSQAHHGVLQKQLHLRSLVLFGLAYMTPIISSASSASSPSCPTAAAQGPICLPPWRCCSPR
jgi:hypothetical protein